MPKEVSKAIDTEVPLAGRPKTGKKKLGSLLQGSSRHCHLTGTLCTQERETKSAAVTLSASLVQEPFQLATESKLRSGQKSWKSVGGSQAAGERAKWRNLLGYGRNWCIRQIQLASTRVWRKTHSLWLCLRLPSSPFHTTAELSSDLQILPGSWSCF